MTARKRLGTAVAAVSLLFGAAVIGVVAGPATAAPNQAPAVQADSAPATKLCEGKGRPNPNPNQHAADPDAPVIAGVNAGNIGTEMECIPVPAPDYAGTAAYQKANGKRLQAASRLKGAPPAPPGTAEAKALTVACATNPGVCYHYAEGHQNGLSGVIAHTWTQRVAKPGLGTDGFHTLAEGTVQDVDATPGVGNDVVELGTTVDVGVCGSTGASPCIFVFHWHGGTPECYNSCGWTNVSGCSPCMGSSVTSWVGTSKIFSLQLVGSYWYAAANNQWVARVPLTEWTSSRFTAGDRIDEFFETATDDPDGQPDTDMGDASLPVCSGTVAGSYFINGTINNPNSANVNYTGVNVLGPVIDTAHYDACEVTSGGATNYFRGGGWGWAAN